MIINQIVLFTNNSDKNLYINNESLFGLWLRAIGPYFFENTVDEAATYYKPYSLSSKDN